MAVQTRLHSGIIEAIFRGSVDLSQMSEVVRAMVALERAQDHSPPTLCVLDSETDIRANFMDIDSLAESCRGVTLRNPVRSAIVTPTAGQFGFARMLQTLNTHPLIQIGVFREKEKAVAWVKGGPGSGGSIL